jgi:hypothetical protein
MHTSPLAQTSDIREYEIMRLWEQNERIQRLDHTHREQERTNSEEEEERTKTQLPRRNPRKEQRETQSHSLTLTLSHAQRQQAQKGEGSKRDSHSITHENKLRDSNLTHACPAQENLSSEERRRETQSHSLRQIRENKRTKFRRREENIEWVREWRKTHQLLSFYGRRRLNPVLPLTHARTREQTQKKEERRDSWSHSLSLREQQVQKKKSARVKEDTSTALYGQRRLNPISPTASRAQEYKLRRGIFTHTHNQSRAKRTRESKFRRRIERRDTDLIHHTPTRTNSEERIERRDSWSQSLSLREQQVQKKGERRIEWRKTHQLLCMGEGDSILFLPLLHAYKRTRELRRKKERRDSDLTQGTTSPEEEEW